MSNTLTAIWQALIYTPWWVYVIFVYCILIGLKAGKGGEAPLWKLLIMPVLFSGLSLHTLFSSFAIDQTVLAIYITSLVAGIVLGYLMYYWQGVQANRQTMTLTIPGSWSTLIVILIIFISKYYFGYAIGADPSVLQNTHFEIAMLGVSGITAGLFVGRMLFCLIKMFVSNKA